MQNMQKSTVVLILTFFTLAAIAVWTTAQNPPGGYGAPANAGGGSGGGGASPGGSNTQFQYNNSNAFAGSAALLNSTTPGASAMGITTTGLVVNDAGGNSWININFASPAGSTFGKASAGAAQYGIYYGMEVANGTQSVSGCSLTAAVGGNSAGKFASGTSGTCTVTITLPTAFTGWTCDAHDLTTAADANNMVQTAFTATTATISGTTVSGDVITWKCMGW